MRALPCIVCGRELEGCSLPNQPLDGLSFYTRGAYGTTLFDPMDGSYIELNVCDPCLSAAGARGRVLHYAGSGKTGPWHPPADHSLGDSCASEASQPAMSVHDERSSSPKPPVEGA